VIPEEFPSTYDGAIGGDGFLASLGLPAGSAASDATSLAREDRAVPVAPDDRIGTDGGTRSPIRVLPVAVAARIAAGEIVERPSSVVKELVENALDAGARAIRVDIRGGGLSSIRVGDDGRGIRAAELWLACQRHATSKLAADDLDQVRTLGFRGEALPSIAAVAELTLVSATDEGGVGWRLALRDGRVVADEPAPRTRGTTATVRHLFQHIPARLAAAGRPQSEVAQIGQTMRRLALAMPTVRLALVVDDRTTLQTSGSGDLSTTLVEVYGTAISGSLIPLGPVEVAGARLAGVVAGPDVTRPGRSGVNLVVNGRWVQPRGLLGVLEAGYRPVLPRGRHPVLALAVEIAPDRVDVNVHPAKLEVRLRDERVIGTALGELVRSALGRRPLPMALSPAVGLAALTQLGEPAHALAESSPDWDDFSPIVTPGLPPLRLIGQVQARLLLLEGPEGLYLVDQHRAHERILYERLTATHGGDAPEPIALPEPLVLEVRPAHVARFAQRLDDLAALGFACEVFGGRTFLLRAMPALPGVSPGSGGDGLAGLGEPDDLVASLLALGDEDAAEGEGWRERLLVQLPAAARSAVVAPSSAPRCAPWSTGSARRARRRSVLTARRS
jgi:DNA mismatch repair protein MutL